MKLVVLNRKFLLTWNLGDGVGDVTHPEVLEPIHDDADHNTYTVDIERVWNTFRLTVERAGSPASTATNSTPGPYGCLQATKLWLGGEGDGLPGCPSLVWFDGEGYAELRRSGFRPSDRRHFSLAFTYGGARLEIAARGRHCHGRPVHVQAARVFASNKLEKGSLRVNGEETLGSPSPPVQSAAALPDLSATTYWVGGAPPGQEAPAPPLLGCLGALSVDREGYDVLDTPTRHGVEARCMARTLRTATLEGTGYIELPCPIFRRKAALGLTFRAASPNGLLLYRTPSTLSENEVDDEDGDDKHYLKLFRTFSPDGLLLLAPGTKTKPKHYLALVVREGRLRLSVRGRRRKEVSIRLSRNRLVLSAGGAAAAAHAPVAQRASRLFVGGVPQPPQLPHIPNSILRVGGFLGCVRRVEVNGRAQDLVRTAAAHHRVGQCFPNVEQAAYFGAVARAETRGPGNKALCDNAWHTVVARVSRAHVSLSLDAGPEIRSSGDATLVDDAETPEALTALYIGGLPDSSDARENFKGCISDVTVGGQKRKWQDMETLHNVLLDSCPVTHEKKSNNRFHAIFVEKRDKSSMRL
ncbi:hypothetical protein MSG28_001930 [Choristoneura fumiferana]|uniref:Uncharacterized protein n=1 Tax=Choristoneura fumiferana TaxID=7141 RepID=A0ACC0JT88_CHOFU|nr:hypothetical protein MSG28_001930 [Choristoneura fumiferana]